MKSKVVCYDKQNPQEPSDLKSDLAIGVKVTGLSIFFVKLSKISTTEANLLPQKIVFQNKQYLFRDNYFTEGWFGRL